jgi:proline iminopeptidase
MAISFVRPAPLQPKVLARANAPFGRVWAHQRIGVAVAVGAAACWAVAAGLWTPRGPLTTGQAIWSMVISLCIGAASGLALRSRWVTLVTPAVFAGVFELIRKGTDGPTVDGIAKSEYGLVAFATGRGFHTLVSLFPLAFGSLVGAGAARWIADRSGMASRSRPRWMYVRRSFAIAATVGLIGFTAMIARPPNTHSIIGASGKPVSGSVAELTSVDINGHRLSMMIRGHSKDNPVLLFLAGGPGGSEMGAMRKHLAELEAHFTVVTWDQRGSGKSYKELDPTDTYTLASATADTVAVTDYLRNRFAKDRVYLMGQSWGTILGVLAVQQRPELFTAFIGTGQMVDPRETDTIIYNDTLTWARANGNTGLVAELTKVGPPPYSRILNYETALSSEHLVYPYDHTANSEGAGGFSENIFVSEYSLVDQVHLLAGFLDTFSVIYPQLQGIDFRRSATTFDVPMFFVEGAHEADGRAKPFAAWYPMINAPIKDLATFDTSGHRPLWEQPGRFVDYMVNTVLAQTAGK